MPKPAYEGPESAGGPSDEIWADLDSALAQGVDPFTEPEPEEPKDAEPVPIPDDSSEAPEDIPEVKAREPEEPEGEKAPEVNYDLEVPVTLQGQDEKMSLSKMKDIVQNTDLEYQNRNLEIMRKEQNIDQLISGVRLTEEQERELQQYREVKTREKQLQIQQTNRMFPQWKDEGLFARDNEAMWETWLAYGQHPEAYKQLTDPGVIRMLYDLTHLREEKARAQSVVKKVKSVPKGPRGRTSQPAQPQKGGADSLDKIFNDAQGSRDHNSEVHHSVWSRLDKALR